jgi:O-antigen ligase
MSARLRAFAVVAVVAMATLGEGGAAAASALATHLALAIAVAAAVFFFHAGTHTPARGPAAAWLVFAVLAAVSAMLAPYAYAAWLVEIEIIAFGSVVWLACGDPGALSRQLVPGVALLAGVHGIVAVTQRFSGNSRPPSSFLNPNHLAAWLAAAAVFLMAGLFGREVRSRTGRLRDGAAVVLALAGVFVTGSRGALLGLAAGATALAFLTAPVVSGRARRALFAAAAAVVLIGVLGVTLRFRSDDDPYRFHRTRIWKASLGAAIGAPVFGVGPGQFAAAAPNLNFALTEAPLNYERGFKTPHSDVLRAVGEFGFPAGAAVLVALSLLALGVARGRLELSSAERAAAAALAALLAQALVDDLSTRPAITLLAAAFAGLLVARRREHPPVPATRMLAGSVAILVVLALGVSELAGYLAWNGMRNLPHGKLDQADLGRLRRSLRWNPMLPAGWQRLSEHFVGDGRSWQVEDYAAAREAAEHARRLQPVDAFYARAVARVDATACLTIFPFEASRRRAAEAYEEASGLARTDATIPLEASKFLLQAGDAVGARRFALRAIAIEPRAATPRLCLAQAILRDRGAEGAAQARRVLDEALTLAPRAGETPTSSYGAALRGIDGNTVEALRRDLDRLDPH